MHILNTRANTFPFTATSSEPNPHHIHNHPNQDHHHQHQLHHLTTSPPITTTSSVTFPRASSEHGLSSETTTCTPCPSSPRTSCSDEAQACFNLLLILRADTQHLISLRNDNLEILEHTAPAGPLLQNINDILAAAAASITVLGPFLERHRWPIPVEAESSSSSHQQLRRSLISSYSLLRPVFWRRCGNKAAAPSRLPPTEAAAMTTTTTTKRRRRRCKSFSGRRSTEQGRPSICEEEAGWLSPEWLFSWTLELTAQHTAALVALDRLEQFLAYGVEALYESEPEVIGAAASHVGLERDKQEQEAAAAKRSRDSWWEQRRGEFENVELIQSLLTGPRRRRLSGGGDRGSAAPCGAMSEMATAAAAAGGGGGGAAPSSSPSGAANESKRRIAVTDGASDHASLCSMTIVSEPPSELSMLSTSSPHWGLTARPRISPKDASPPNEDEEQQTVRTWRVRGEPVNYPSTPQTRPPQESPDQMLSDQTQLSSQSETFGQRDKDTATTAAAVKSSTTILPLSRFNSLKQRPRIATQPLPPLVGLPTLLPERLATITGEVGRPSIHNPTMTTASNNDNNKYFLLPVTSSGSPSSALSGTTPLFSPLLTPDGIYQQATTPSASPSSPFDKINNNHNNAAAGAGAGPVDTPFTPITPLDQQLATLFAQKAFPSKSKTIQPEIRELGDSNMGGRGGGGMMVVSPVESQEVHIVAAFEEHVSPITTTTSVGGSSGRRSSQRRQGSLASLSLSQQEVVSRLSTSPSPPNHRHHNVLQEEGQGDEEGEEEDEDECDDRHWPYLAYMARKQAVATSRWSLRRSGRAAGESG